jgi:hypothetical protein
MYNERCASSPPLPYAKNRRSDMGDRHAGYLDVSLSLTAKTTQIPFRTICMHPTTRHNCYHYTKKFYSSLVEANLVIITACLPTMRLFFRHVAPGLIGESSLRSTRNRSRKQGSNTRDRAGDSSHHSELATIGSRGAKASKYNRVDDDVVTIGSEERTTAGWRGDADSVRGIVVSLGSTKGITKTSSVVVESEVLDERDTLGGLRQNTTRVDIK